MISSKKFVRTIEDFTCANCGASVSGTGYTNHCPKCLWSKHVDINPGDRAEGCGGMMEPVRLEIKSGENIITHCCIKCGYEKNNKVSAGDDTDKIIGISNH